MLPPQGSSETEAQLNRLECCDFHLGLFRDYGIADGLTYPGLTLGCMATQNSSWVVGPEDELYKCLQDASDSGMVIGSLADDRPWNRGLFMRYMMDSDPFERAECRECFFLPVCDGGCVNMRVRGLPTTSPTACCPYKDRLREFLEAYFDVKSSLVNSESNTTRTLSPDSSTIAAKNSQLESYVRFVR